MKSLEVHPLSESQEILLNEILESDMNIYGLEVDVRNIIQNLYYYELERSWLNDIRTNWIKYKYNK